MRISVKVAEIYSRYLPGGSDSTEVDVADNSTAMDVLAALEMPQDGAYLMVLNDAVLPKSKRTEQPLSDGDELAIMMPLKGG